jgi:hypothetical protein
VCRLLHESKSKLREVEEELSLLRRDIKMTSAPKKQAMELMRRKIEARGSARGAARRTLRSVCACAPGWQPACRCTDARTLALRVWPGPGVERARARGARHEARR